METTGHPSDQQLAISAAGGDRDALGSLYERYFEGLYDFALRTARDPEVAADVVQGTFVRAWESLQRGTQVRNVKAWLYTITRNGVMDEFRRTRRVAQAVDTWEEEPLGFTMVDTERLTAPEEVVRDQELVSLVWEAAGSLNPEEYSLLDMHVRQELTADELAKTLELKKGAVYTRLSRLRRSLEESVTSLLLMRRGRRDCAELDALLSEVETDRPTSRTRRLVQKHLDECSQCQESKRRLVSPVEIFAGLAPVPIDSGLKMELWEGIATRLDGGPPGGETDRPGRRTLQRASTLVGTALVTMLLAGGAVALAPNQGEIIGGCTVTASSDLDTTTVVDTSRVNPFDIDSSGSLAFEATTPAAFRNNVWRVWVYVGGVRVPVASGTHSNEGGGTVEARRVELAEFTTLLESYPGVGRLVGIYRVGGEIRGEGGSCMGSGYVRIPGNPVESGAGLLGGILFAAGAAGMVATSLGVLNPLCEVSVRRA